MAVSKADATGILLDDERVVIMGPPSVLFLVTERAVLLGEERVSS